MSERVLKFRAYSKSEGKCYYQDDYDQFPEFWMFWRFADRHKLPVEQFTGLHDKNGKEIYEGDRLRDDVGDLHNVVFGKLPLDKSGDCVCTYEAFYCECLGQLGQAPCFQCQEIGEWMEIIGNIHEEAKGE